MQAIRNIYTVQNNQIVITLPNTFQHKAVEVIVLPFDEYETAEKTQQDKNAGLKRLLAFSVWSENDIQQISETQNFINQWKIEEF